MELSQLDIRSIDNYGKDVVKKIEKTVQNLGAEFTDYDQNVLTPAVKGNMIDHLSKCNSLAHSGASLKSTLDKLANQIYNNAVLPFFKDIGVEVYSPQKTSPVAGELFLTERDKELLMTGIGEVLRNLYYSLEHNKVTEKQMDTALKNAFNDYLKTDGTDLIKEKFYKGYITFRDFLMEVEKQKELNKEQELDTNHAFVLTEKGTETVTAYIEELKAKQKEIVDAGLDTADEVTLPTVGTILSDIEFMGLDDDGFYYNNWAVTNEYDGDNALCLELGKDFVHNELYRDNNSKGIVAESPFSMVTNDEQDIER